MSADNYRPIAHCYWVEPRRLLAGEYPGARDEAEAREWLRHFLSAGVNFFLDLTHAGEGALKPYAHLLADEARIAGVAAEHWRFPLRDMSVPAPETMAEILDTIDRALAEGRTAYVHCWGGVGRTGMVVGCYLVRRGLSGDAALQQIARWWATLPPGKRLWHPRSPETSEQENFVRNWREG
jgi:hypothetical protein